MDNSHSSGPVPATQTDPPLDLRAIPARELRQLRVREPYRTTEPGYVVDFLGTRVPTPRLTGGLAGTSARHRRLDYMHNTVYLDTQRRLARWAAWNIDVVTLRDGNTVSRSGQKFRLDTRVPATAQVGDELYKNNPLDRGHIARRADLLWGTTDDEVKKANSESFFFPNITPQMEELNQSGKGGAWGAIEVALTEYLHEAPLARASVLGGPVLGADDPTYRGVRVPLSFWKVLAYRDSTGALACRAFVVTQSIARLPRAALQLDVEYEIYGLSLDDLAARLELDFPDGLHRGDAYKAEGVREAPHKIEDPAAIRWDRSPLVRQTHP